MLKTVKTNNITRQKKEPSPVITLTALGRVGREHSQEVLMVSSSPSFANKKITKVLPFNIPNKGKGKVKTESEA